MTTEIDMIIFHHTAGQIGIKETVKDWRDEGNKVSAHYIVERNDDGSGVANYEQIIPLELAAHHANNFGNIIGKRSIGIEIVNWGSLRKVGNYYYPENPDANVKIDPDMRGEVGVMSGTEGGDDTFWQIYTPAQYRALQMIILELRDAGIPAASNPGKPPFFQPTFGPAIRGRNLFSTKTGRNPLFPKDLADPADLERYKDYILNDYAGGWIGHSAVSTKRCPGPYLTWGNIYSGIGNYH